MKMRRENDCQNSSDDLALGGNSEDAYRGVREV